LFNGSTKGHELEQQVLVIITEHDASHRHQEKVKRAVSALGDAWRIAQATSAVTYGKERERDVHIPNRLVVVTTIVAENIVSENIAAEKTE